MISLPSTLIKILDGGFKAREFLLHFVLDLLSQTTQPKSFDFWPSTPHTGPFWWWTVEESHPERGSKDLYGTREWAAYIFCIIMFCRQIQMPASILVQIYCRRGCCHSIELPGCSTQKSPPKATIKRQIRAVMLPMALPSATQRRSSRPSGRKKLLIVVGLEIATQVAQSTPIQQMKPSSEQRRTLTKWVLIVMQECT